MSTPTPRTDALAKREFLPDGVWLLHARTLEAELAAVAAALTTLTCTHHNDKQRAECPVCLVATLTDEIKRLKRDYDYNHRCLHEVRGRCESWKQRAESAERAEAALTAERDKLRNLLVIALRSAGDQEARASRAEAEFATDRARMDWLESPAGYDWLWHSTHSVIVRRTEIDAAMKEGAE